MKSTYKSYKQVIENMIEYHWTIRAIRGMFNVPTPICHQIQDYFNVDKAIEIANAAHELNNGQVGF